MKFRTHYTAHIIEYLLAKIESISTRITVLLIEILIIAFALHSHSLNSESLGFQEIQNKYENKNKYHNPISTNQKSQDISDKKYFSSRFHSEEEYEPMFSLPLSKIFPKNVTNEDLIYAQANTGTNRDSNKQWEEELEKELREIEEREKAFDQSRGFTSPTQIDPLTGDRSNQNLMMDMTAAVDLVGSWDNNKPQTTSNSLDLREAEFGFFGAIDQWGRGNLLVAAHNENGKYMFEVHEANIIFPFLSKYVNLKVGKMFLDWGRLNRIHRHDWPFTMAPIVHEKLMDREAVEDTGGEVSFLIPFFEKFTQELVLGATNGRYWGHTHNGGLNKNNPMFYAHLKNFYYIGDNWGAQFGGTAVRFEPDPASNAERRQYGLDAVLRWNRSNLRSFILMSELWYRENRFPKTTNPDLLIKEAVPMDTQWGYYIFLDYQFAQQWLIGYRYDFFNVPNLRDSQGNFARNAVEANTIQVTYRPSEFSFIRISTERRYTADFSRNDNEEFVDYRYYVQATFLLGSHPAHQY
ncbi:hypothetical protein [Leptospira sp. GIMC2001]|uniref:hypothetical protein n=1 Tax=Leptospira sp. GIMC2001 TaxID=1513297 RepID=UPI002349B484|nr:hypothetical protein [Leptospira sp. GIMC2001]WCL48358.1 hypothetical protein O4O04_13715 [Leptospira sp. GIMC2001]